MRMVNIYQWVESLRYSQWVKGCHICCIFLVATVSLPASADIINTSVIFNNGAVNTVVGGANTQIGQTNGDTGSVTVLNPGTAWNMPHSLRVGNNGTGTLSISNQGVVNSSNGRLGFNPTGDGSVTVTGAGSQWNITNSLHVGARGSGALTITDGATVSNTSVRVGREAGSTGTVTVDGVGSTWTTTSLQVGRNGSGTLDITNGGAVNSTNGRIGFNAGSSGAVTIDGANSNWTINNSLIVGRLGSGVLNISNSGLVVADEVSRNAASTGSTINFDGGTLRLSDNDGSLFDNFTAANTIALQANGGTIDTQGFAVTTDNGAVISGAGPLTKEGAGTLTLTGANTYTGATNINSGTVNANNASALGNNSAVTVNTGATLNLGNSLTSGSLAGGGNVNLNANTLTTGNNNSDTTFSGVISGTGGLIKDGAGVLTLSGANTYSGATTVNAGTVKINGNTGSSIATINNGATVAGNGTLGGLIVESGAVAAPGNGGIGTLNVTGDVTFNNGSTYQVETDPAGNADKITATGAGAINGGTVSVLAGGGNYSPSTDYTILTANGGVAGTFSGVTSDLAFLDPTLTYDANNVILTLARNTVGVGDGGTFNQQHVGNAVDGLPTGNPVFSAVIQLNAEQASKALDQLSGEVHSSIHSHAMQDVFSIHRAINLRSRQAFNGIGAKSIAHNNIQYAAVGNDSAHYLAAAETPLFWTQGWINWGDLNDDNNASGLDSRTFTSLMGADIPLAKWRVGAMFGLGKTDWNVNGLRSSAESTNYHLGAYGARVWHTHTEATWSLRLNAAYALHDVDSQRHVNIGALNTQLRADYDIHILQANAELAYQFNLKNLAVEPYAVFSYVASKRDGFTEKGGAAALKTKADHEDIAYTTAGTRLSSPLNIGTVDSHLWFDLGWRHLLNNPQTHQTNRFVDAGSQFRVKGVTQDRDTVVVEAGFNYSISGHTGLNFTLNTLLGSDTENLGASLTYYWRF